jgi:hypothetical protein
LHDVTLTQWIISTALVGMVFASGIFVGNITRDVPAIPPPITVLAPVGEFTDVPMRMTASSGNTFRFVCDLHLPLPPERREATCEYADP